MDTVVNYFSNEKLSKDRNIFVFPPILFGGRFSKYCCVPSTLFGGRASKNRCVPPVGFGWRASKYRCVPPMGFGEWHGNIGVYLKMGCGGRRGAKTTLNLEGILIRCECLRSPRAHGRRGTQSQFEHKWDFDSRVMPKVAKGPRAAMQKHMQFEYNAYLDTPLMPKVAKGPWAAAEKNTGSFNT